MKTQTFTGTVLDSAGDPWADALVELQLDDGSGEISSGPVVTGVTDVDGDFSIDAFNNAEDAQVLLIRLPNGNVFKCDVDPDDDTVDLGDLESSGGSDAARLSEIPSSSTGTIPVKATGAEVDTGTNDAKFLTPKAIEDSDYIKAAAVTSAIAAAIALADAGLAKRQRVRAATIGNITIATALNNGDTLDGVTLATGDLVLVKDQSTASQNGIYVVGVTPARDAEFDTYNEHPGSLIAVQEGTVNADKVFLCTSNTGGTLDTTAIAFAAFGAGIGGSTGSTDNALLRADGTGGLTAQATGITVSDTDQLQLALIGLLLGTLDGAYGGRLYRAGADIWFACPSGGGFGILNASGVEKAVFKENTGWLYIGGNVVPTNPLDIAGDSIRIRTTQTPASAAAAGVAGTICWDSSFIYVCVATDTWKRVAIATW